MTNTAKYLAGVALILGGVFASAALAQNAPAAGQEPPPKPDDGTTSQLEMHCRQRRFQAQRR